MPIARWIPIGLALSAIGLMPGARLYAAEAMSCRMNFTLTIRAAFYQRGEGTAEVSCDNGQTRTVYLRSRGGGVNFGKSTIRGIGKFSGIVDIDDIFGSYLDANAHAGNASGAAAMTKGDVSLALSGTGRGPSLGFAFGKFTISRRKLADD